MKLPVLIYADNPDIKGHRFGEIWKYGDELIWLSPEYSAAASFFRHTIGEINRIEEMKK